MKDQIHSPTLKIENLSASNSLASQAGRMNFSKSLILAGFGLILATSFSWKAQAIPGDMLDQALHQSMREHSKAQKELTETGTTRVADQDSTPTVQSDALRIVVGQGEILADVNADLASNSATIVRGATFGVNEPTRHDASSSIGSKAAAQVDMSDSESADQELPDPAE